MLERGHHAEDGSWYASARYSDDEQYRYRLMKTWYTASDPGGWHRPRWLNYIMLNPSTATEEVLDPTLRRCEGFARQFGYDGMIICNLFALRATDPKVMLAHPEPVGAYNDVELMDMAIMAGLFEEDVIVAWGTHGGHLDRGQQVLELLYRNGITPLYFGKTKGGHPKHPLYLKGDTVPAPA